MTSKVQNQKPTPANPHELFSLFYDEHQAMRKQGSWEAAELYFWAADRMDGLFKGQTVDAWADLYRRMLIELKNRKAHLQHNAAATEGCEAIEEIIKEQVSLLVRLNNGICRIE